LSKNGSKVANEIRSFLTGREEWAFGPNWACGPGNNTFHWIRKVNGPSAQVVPAENCDWAQLPASEQLILVTVSVRGNKK
jgi:hypothetical protein